MTINRLLAQMTVSDLDRAVSWYARLFGRGPDARPMEGLVERHLRDAFGIHVWLDPERAGRSTMVLEESDLDGRAADLACLESSTGIVAASVGREPLFRGVAIGTSSLRRSIPLEMRRQWSSGSAPRRRQSSWAVS